MDATDHIFGIGISNFVCTSLDINCGKICEAVNRLHRCNEFTEVWALEIDNALVVSLFRDRIVVLYTRMHTLAGIELDLVLLCWLTVIHQCNDLWFVRI